jgi:adenosyl cobinamide kinase/adenosyl cobinamide phosphate guanylyltransferase
MKQGQKLKRLSVRLGVEEWDFLQREAEESGVVLSDFVRAWVRDRMGVENKKEYRKKKPRKKYREKNTEEYREIAAQIAKVGNNVNQLARWANTFKSAADTARVVRVLAGVIDKMETIIAMVRGA